MVQVTVGKHTYTMNHYLKDNLDIAKKLNNQDWDNIWLVDGPEGSGKSVLALQMGYYLDPTLDINRICFTPQEFKKAIIDAKKGQTIIFDEAFTGLSSSAAMSFINRMIVNLLAEIRQKRLFIFIVAPTFFDIQRYVAIWRSRALIHVYAPAMKRGFFMFFNEGKKSRLYILGKKLYDYSRPKSNFVACFPHFYPINEEEYRAKKLESLKGKDANTPKMKWFEQRNSLIRVLFEMGWKVPQITESINKYIEKPLTTRAIYRITGGRTDFEAEL